MSHVSDPERGSEQDNLGFEPDGGSSRRSSRLSHHGVMVARSASLDEEEEEEEVEEEARWVRNWKQTEWTHPQRSGVRVGVRTRLFRHNHTLTT